MNVKTVIEIDLGDPEQARTIARSLAVDDDRYLTTLIREGAIRAEITTSSVESARRSADDWLACLNAIIKK